MSNIKLKFALGSKVVVPVVGVTGTVNQVAAYIDGSKQILVRWAKDDGSLHSGWFCEKELKVPKPNKNKKKPVRVKAAKKKRTTRRRPAGSW